MLSIKQLKTLSLLRVSKKEKLAVMDGLVKEYYKQSTNSSRKSSITKQLGKLEKELVNINIAISNYTR